jgi:hypothetical protein
MEKRKSIMHALNVFLVNPINVYLKRETQKYVIGYEPKHYRIHHLLFKFSKDLINNFQFNTVNEIRINSNIDINIREDYRFSIKANNPIWNIKMKNIVARIIPTRHADLQPLYGMIYHFGWRHTGAGGRDFIQFSIPECPLIVSNNTISSICYKLISTQISGGGTHSLHTYIIISLTRGQFHIGDWVKITNVNKSGHQHMYTYPVFVTL